MTQALATAPQPVSRVQRIEDGIDRPVAGAIAVSSAVGGMIFNSMVEVMEFSKLMAVSDVAVPKHLRGNPGACMAVCIQAIEWRMSPYAVANKSYVVNDRISYESQLIHAVIEQRAPIVSRLRHSYSGQGDNRTCKVWATGKGEKETFEYTSAEFGRIQPKNSPLWKTKPDLQLYYNASRDWARMYYPDVILGVYADDEIEPEPTPGPLAEGTKPFGFTPPKQITAPAAAHVAPVVAQVPPKPAQPTNIFTPAPQEQPVVQETVEQELPANINPETGEYFEDAQPAADSDDATGDREAAAIEEEEKSPPPPPPPPAVAKDQLPADATWDWMVRYAIAHAPPQHMLNEIEVKSQVNVSMNKPWGKTTRAEQESTFAKVRDGTFGWRPGKAAREAAAG